MAEVIQEYNKLTGEEQYPVTIPEAVIFSDGRTLDEHFNDVPTGGGDYDALLQQAQNAAQSASSAATSAASAQQHAASIDSTLDTIAKSGNINEATAAKVTELALKVGEIEGEKASVEISDSNDRLVERKVNAILECLRHLIPNVVFHNGVPYPIPTELNTNLKLDAHNTRSFAYGLSFPLTLN